MKSIIGFLPTKSTNELHARVKNLTGEVIEINERTVLANFDITVNKKVETVTVEYPLNQCKDYFVGNPIRMNGLSFHQFCTALIGFDVYSFNNLVPRWVLFWGGYNAKDILSGNTKFRVEQKPQLYNYLKE